MCGALKGAERSSIGAEPEASTTCCALSSRRAPSCAVNSTRRPDSSRPWPCSPVTPAPLKSATIPWVMALHDAGLALLHLCQIERDAGDPDAVGGELLVRAVVELG